MHVVGEERRARSRVRAGDRPVVAAERAILAMPQGGGQSFERQGLGAQAELGG
jgi:hypothetical protein